MGRKRKHNRRKRVKRAERVRRSGGRPRRPRRRRRYDTQMIRDFFEHLLWEWRVHHYENIHPVGATNTELVDQLAKYTGKYPGSPALLVNHRVHHGSLSPEQVEEASRLARQEWSYGSALIITLLERLEPVLEQALACADSGAPAIFRDIDLAEVLEQAGSDGELGQTACGPQE